MVYAVIMAGGSGTRFWPKSTKALPKQFLNLFGESTMIQNTAKRLEGIIPQERVLVVTNDSYVPIVKEQLPKVPEENIVGEPVAKNTAPCVAIAAELLYKKDPNAVMVVLPADHHITNEPAFIEILNSAIKKAESGNHLVTIGIEPSHPETGFGYIHADKNESLLVEGKEVLKVNCFKEKPDYITAQSFLDSGDYFWNSGMFVWKAETVLQEIEKQLPAMYDLVKESSPEFYTEMHGVSINEFYLGCESISIDYGIMENAKEVFVVPGEFGWNDVGSWTAVYDLAEKVNNGNAIQCINSTLTNSNNNLIMSNSEKMISIVGLDNVAVVETDSALLICNLEQAQGVKDIVEQLKDIKDFNKFL